MPVKYEENSFLKQSLLLWHSIKFYSSILDNIQEADQLMLVQDEDTRIMGLLQSINFAQLLLNHLRHLATSKN